MEVAQAWDVCFEPWQAAEDKAQVVVDEALELGGGDQDGANLWSGVAGDFLGADLDSQSCIETEVT